MKPSEYVFIKNELEKGHTKLRKRFSVISFVLFTLSIGFLAGYLHLKVINETMGIIGIMMLIAAAILKIGSLFVEDANATQKVKELNQMYNARHLDENSFEEAIKKLGLA